MIGRLPVITRAGFWRRFGALACAASALALFAAYPAAARAGTAQAEGSTPDAPVVLRLAVDGTITPVVAGYIERGIEEASSSKCALLVIVLDTPGGLMSSTRQIVKALLSAPVPVAVFVAPPGSRAASAGVFITMAANVAAMAPGTNIGAAHPVSVGGGFFRKSKPEGKDGGEKEKTEGAKDGRGDAEKGGSGEGEKEREAARGREGEGAEKTEGAEKSEGARGREGEGAEKSEPVGDDEVMGEKVLNDTVAFVRSIAERRGRNADWAERAVRESVSVTEAEALGLGVIDLVAEDLEAMLGAASGRTVKVLGEDVVLALDNATVRDMPMGWGQRMLAALADPNVAYILMMLGIYGIFFELANPGVIFPGVLGGIFLILAFFSFQVLPVNYAGLLLIILALILFILEVKVVSYGMLTVGGVLSLFLGSVMLFDSAEPYLRLSLWMILGATAASALLFIVGLGMAFRIQRRRVTTGAEGLVGEVGTASTPLSPEGKVKVHGELWNAVADAPVDAGERVRVTAVEGMRLRVEKKT